VLADRSPHPAPGEGKAQRNLKENRKYLHLEIAFVSSLGGLTPWGKTKGA
jgi:hypothetical protein